jgi:heat shock protein beta
MRNLYYALVVATVLLFGTAHADDEVVEDDVGTFSEGSRTDADVVGREEEAIQLDGLNVAEMKALRESAEKHHFQAEVNRMMKLIINSLYKNKEIFLRELISNASDALDKIRFLSVTDKSALEANEELSIRIKADKENNLLHIIDTGIGMSEKDLINNLGTIAKSGTSDFLSKLSEGDANTDLIGQFGVGFYSSFLVADRVFVTSKNNDDPKQHIWESDSAEFTVAEDPRGNTLLRGTQLSLHMRPESLEFLETSKLEELVRKYSQFINFPIYLWKSKTITEEVPVEDEAPAADSDDDVVVEEEKDTEPKTIEKTVWDWERMNEAKPIWLRKTADVTDEEYKEFFKSFSKNYEDPLAYTHFTAEGEVTFKSILFIPKTAPGDTYTDSPIMDKIKIYVKRVFIADNVEDLMPKYLSFIFGIVDSDDLPLNVSRETLQQSKLIKVIKKKLVRKVLDMIKKMDEKDYEEFWKQYGVKLKFGVIEDSSNKTRLAKLLRFYTSSSEDKPVSLESYVERMKSNQENIYFMGGQSKTEIRNSPFVEKLLKKGYEVVYLIEPIDEYAIQAMPDFEGKKFQNVAKDGLKVGKDSDAKKERLEKQQEEFKPLLDWLKETGLQGRIEKATVSDRLDTSPCALVASQYGWSGNMERIMKAQGYHRADSDHNSYYTTQKQTLEVNPRHPLIKELMRQVVTDGEDQGAKDFAANLLDTAILRSGFSIENTVDFAARIEAILKSNYNIDANAEVEAEPEYPDEEEEEEAGEEVEEADAAEEDEGREINDEL